MGRMKILLILLHFSHALSKRCEQLEDPICATDEVFCPGGMDFNNCSMPGFCLQTFQGADGTECPIFCPANCSYDEMVCSGVWNENGCQVSEDTCIPIQSPSTAASGDGPIQCPIHAILRVLALTASFVLSFAPCCARVTRCTVPDTGMKMAANLPLICAYPAPQRETMVPIVPLTVRSPVLQT